MAYYTCLLLVLSKLSHKYSAFIQLPTWKPISAQERTETISEFNTEKYELMWFTEGTGGYAVLRSELELMLPCCVLRCLYIVLVACVFLSLSDQPQVSREKTSGGGSMWSPGPLFTRKRLISLKIKAV